MATSSAATVDEYIGEFDPTVQSELRKIRHLIQQSIDPIFVESMTWGMPGYEVPLAISGPTYNRQPLIFAGFAKQKNYYSLYLMSVAWSPEYENDFRARYEIDGKKLNMGKSCLRFKEFKDLNLEAVAAELGRYTAQSWSTRVAELRAAANSSPR